MRGLNFSQAFALSKTGVAVRRDAWRKWLTRHHALSWIWTPPIAEAPAEEHVVLNTEVARAEMLAADWTDEPWAVPGVSTPGVIDCYFPPYRSPPDPGRPRPPRGGGFGGGDNPPGPGGEPGPGPGPGGPPPPGGTTDPDPIIPSVPDDRPAGGPTITVTIQEPDDSNFEDFLTDGHCFFGGTMDPRTLAEMIVDYSIAGGPPGVGTMTVDLQGDEHGGMTGWPGKSDGESFTDISYLPGATVTATVTYTIGGTPYTGTGEYTFPDWCGSGSSSGGGGGMI